MYNWTKLNYYFLITLGTLTAIKYISEYIDFLNDKFVPDAIRFFFVGVFVFLCCCLLLIISITKKAYTCAIFDFVSGLLQLFVVGLRGRHIPLYGMVISGIIIFIALLMLILIGKSNKASSSLPL